MFTKFFDELRAPLLRYVASLGVPPQDGEEIVQEAFLALLQHLEQDKPRHNLRGWMFRVGHLLALKRRARNGRMAETVERPDPALNPEEQVEWRRRRERLLAVVQALPERDRRCLSLRAEGRRYREIAAELDMSLGAVAASLNRSLEKLEAAGRR